MKLLAYIFFCSQFAAAEESFDSTKVHQVGEVTVTSTRFVQSRKTSPLQYTVLDKQAMRSFNATSLADIMRSMDGVMMKQYAGNSGIKTISQRGMGSEHTVVLLNGMRISLAQNSLLDFGLFNIESFDAIELISGGSSSLYGADAVSGAVNIITRTSKDPSTVEGKYGIGSFGQRRYSLSAGMNDEQSGFRIGFVDETSKEDYPFSVFFGPDKISSTRTNADFGSKSFYALTDGLISNRISYMLYTSWFSSGRGVPGVFTSQTGLSQARQKDEDIIITGGISYAISDSVSLNTQILTHHFYERYRDPSIVVGNITVDNYFVNVDARLNSSLIVREENGLWNVGGEVARIIARGNSVRNDVERNVLSGFLTYERSIPANRRFLGKIVLLPSARVDAISQFPAIVSPSFAISFVSSSFDLSSITNLTAVLRASMSRNYSAPTFNQLYYSGGGGIGNPDVRPERGISHDIGSSLYFDLHGTHEISAKYFRIRVKDRIVWVSTGGNSVTPKNIRETESDGVELRYQSSLLNNIARFQFGYSTISARKISPDFPGDPNVGKYLIYVPSESFISSLALNVPVESEIVAAVAALGEIQRIGFRYVNEDNVRFLPSVTLLNMNIQANFKYGAFASFVKFEINNITDQQYQVLASYPMPGRSLRLTTGVQF